MRAGTMPRELTQGDQGQFKWRAKTELQSLTLPTKYPML